MSAAAILMRDDKLFFGQLIGGKQLGIPVFWIVVGAEPLVFVAEVFDVDVDTQPKGEQVFVLGLEDDLMLEHADRLVRIVLE